MHIDQKLAGFKSFLSENRLNNGGVKTSIDQSAVASSQQNNVAMNLDDETKQGHEKAKKKKKEQAEALKKKADELPRLNDADIKTRNLKLLNLI